MTLFNWSPLVLEFSKTVSGQHVTGFVRKHSDNAFAWTAFFDDVEVSVSSAGMCKTAAEAMTLATVLPALVVSFI